MQIVYFSIIKNINLKIKVMKIIKLTSLSEKTPIYINVECIGHFYEVKETSSYGSIDKEKHTTVGVTTHNNGGFKVIESVDQIIKLISKI
jgi:hypothetical protein